MTLEEAVAILNEKAHNGSNTWRLMGITGAKVGCSFSTKRLTEFEAIAIARAYINVDESSSPENRPIGQMAGDMCQHANEVPNVCPCGPECSCRTRGSCRRR